MGGAESQERSERVGWDSDIAKFEDEVTETKRTSSGEGDGEEDGIGLGPISTDDLII